MIFSIKIQNYTCLRHQAYNIIDMQYFQYLNFQLTNKEIHFHIFFQELNLIRLYFDGNYFVDATPAADRLTHRDSHGNVVNIFQWASSYPAYWPYVYVSTITNDARDCSFDRILTKHYAVCVTP